MLNKIPLSIYVIIILILFLYSCSSEPKTSDSFEHIMREIPALESGNLLDFTDENLETKVQPVFIRILTWPEFGITKDNISYVANGYYNDEPLNIVEGFFDLDIIRENMISAGKHSINYEGFEVWMSDEWHECFVITENRIVLGPEYGAKYYIEWANEKGSVLYNSRTRELIEKMPDNPIVQWSRESSISCQILVITHEVIDGNNIMFTKLAQYENDGQLEKHRNEFQDSIEDIPDKEWGVEKLSNVNIDVHDDYIIATYTVTYELGIDDYRLLQHGFQ